MTEYPQVWIAKPVAARIGAVELAQRTKGRGKQSLIEVTPEVYGRLMHGVEEKAFGASYGRQAVSASERVAFAVAEKMDPARFEMVNAKAASDEHFPYMDELFGIADACMNYPKAA